MRARVIAPGPAEGPSVNPWLERLRHAPQEDAPSASDAENGQDDQRDIIAVTVWSEILGAAIWVVVDDLPRDQWPTDDPVYEYAEVKRLIGRGADALRSVHLVKMVFAARLVAG